VEATLNFSRSLGIDWDYELQRRQSTQVPWIDTPVWAEANAPVTYPRGGNLYRPTFQTNTPAGFASNLGLLFNKLGSFGLYGSRIDARIALAETNNELKTLSAPKIVTRDTVSATITQGTQINVPSGTDANGNTTFTQVQASLTLTVTPTITPNDMVIMQVEVNDDSPDFANASAGNIPIKTKRATTTMMVKSGETVVIAGIYKETDTNNLELIPFLSKIPLLGWLFKTSFKSKENVELLIFITPSVLPALI
jgi:type IV pilus assembly protein PilQ